MARYFRKLNKKRGAAPGALVFVGVEKTKVQTISTISYTNDYYDKIENTDVESLKAIHSSTNMTWINVVGVSDAEQIQKIGDSFGLHILTQEDIMNTAQRPKYEEYDNHLFIVVKMLSLNSNNIIESEQVSIIVGPNFLITFQEAKEDVFSPVRERISRPSAKIRSRGSDYLAFALLDVIVDEYIIIIETFGSKIELLENELLEKPTSSHIEQINLYKREINFLRKTVRPLRELIFQYIKSDTDLKNLQTLPFLKDLEDHATQASEAVEIYREMLNDQLDIYNSALNHKLNEIMRVLTLFSVVFIPLTFIAGIYGTNFKYFPELEFQYAYPTFWIVLLVVAAGMIYYFKRKNWL